MKLKGMTTHKEVLARHMKRPGFKEGYERLDVEFKIHEALIVARMKNKMTQRELAKKLDIPQSALARFESGRGNPTLSFLQKITEGLGLKLTVS